jgi:hypothetical protein
LVNIFNGWFAYDYLGRSPNYGRNSNILIPDPYHYICSNITYLTDHLAHIAMIPVKAPKEWFEE